MTRTTLTMRLYISTRDAAASGDRAVDECDDLGGLIASICDHLERFECAKFTVSGFGDPKWPVTVSTDLAVILEQLPGVSRALNERHEEFQLEFFEQGVERLLEFNRRGEDLDVTCSSQTGWIPSPQTMRMPAAEMAAQVKELRATFLRVVDWCLPEVRRHPWLECWAHETKLR